MAPIKLVVDTGAGLPADLVARYNIGVIPLQVTVEGKTYQEGEISVAKIAQAQRVGKEVKTSLPSPGVAKQVFETIVDKEGFGEIIALTLPAHSSGTFESIRQGAQMLLAERPSQKLRIEVIDSFTTSMGQWFLLRRLIEKIEAGACFEYVKNAAEMERWNIFVCAALETVKYAHAHGRVKGTLQVFASRLKLHPTLILLPNEPPRLFGSLLNWHVMKRTCSALVEKVAEYWREYEGIRLAVIQTDNQERAEALADSLSWRLKVPREDILVADASAVLTGQAGYGAVGVAVDCGRPINWQQHS